MDIMNPAAAQVKIICEEKVQYSFVSHLSAALRREGISVSVVASTAGYQRQAISVVVVSNNWNQKFVGVIERRRDNSTRVTHPMLWDGDPFNGVYELANRLLDNGNLSQHQSSSGLTDSRLVEEIIKDVYVRLYRVERVGIYSKLLEIDNLLYKQPHDVQRIGIWGMPGIGKTTLAKAVFSHMSANYDASCFIENFDEAFHKKGLHHLLEEKIGKLLEEEFDIKNSYIMRPSLHKDKLWGKRIFVVLDDVRDFLAAESFLGRLDWFAPGSLRWEAAFFKLKKCPPQKIFDVLKNAYGALDDNEKNIVLDIALFFKGENVNHVVQLLERCHYLPRVGIDVLVDKCVLTISENTVQMTNHLQDICQKIFSGEIESCTKMWEPSNIRYLLEDDELKESGESSTTPKYGWVVEDIESIFLDTSNLNFDGKHDAFKNMLNLKFLKIYNSCSKHVHGLNFPKGLDSLPCGLILLHWENYPLQSLPQNFNFESLIELCLSYSQLHTRGTRTKNLKDVEEDQSLSFPAAS